MPDKADDDILVCEQCGVVSEHLTGILREKQRIINALNKHAAKDLLIIRNLQQEKSDRLREHKRAAEAKDVLEHWACVCYPGKKPGTSTIREPFNDERMEAVLARLNGGFTVLELKQCADGYGKFPYVVDAKRMARGKRTQKYVEAASHVYGSEARVQSGLALAGRGDEDSPEPVDVSRLDWRQVRYKSHHGIVKALTGVYGKPSFDEFSRSHRSTCPRCEGALTVFDTSTFTESMLVCNGVASEFRDGCGLDEAAFFKAIEEREA